MLTKVHLVKAMFFPIIMYGYKSWTIKKAEHQRSDAFELWYWIRLLRVPWTARRSNQSILKEISPKYSLEGLMLKLKLQYFGHLMQRTDSLEKILVLRKTEGRRRGWQRIRRLKGISDSMDMSWANSRSFMMDREPWCTAVHGVAKSWTWLSDWTELNPKKLFLDVDCTQKFKLICSVLYYGLNKEYIVPVYIEINVLFKYNMVPVVDSFWCLAKLIQLCKV